MILKLRPSRPETNQSMSVIEGERIRNDNKKWTILGQDMHCK